MSPSTFVGGLDGWKRCTLHKAGLESFKSWLDDNGMCYRDGKGQWQVLQVLTDDYGWQCIFDRVDTPEHFSMNEKLMPTVRKFLSETRSSLNAQVL